MASEIRLTLANKKNYVVHANSSSTKSARNYMNFGHGCAGKGLRRGSKRPKLVEGGQIAQ